MFYAHPGISLALLSLEYFHLAYDPASFAIMITIRLKSGFQLTVESNSRLLWFCITKRCDWLTKLAPLSQPMGIQTKTNRVLAARVFPRLASVTYICFEF